ncbi:LysM peptidoglycan-binding domain-containing protein [Nocardia sp. NPDC050406]|uniref:LysM peptidoglycan-binding domain-containing protein n=1 Tax=Nocardia sp. NPDC050406 TaxID=3364318 RepID=UPI00379576F5
MSSVYTVVSGDTLSEIALRFYGDGSLFPILAAANGIQNPDLIFPGQVLRIPDISTGPRLPAVYVVVEGDTLFDIAARFYGDGNKFPIIAAANGIANPDLIHPGQILTIPALPGEQPPPPPPGPISFRILRPPDLVDLHCTSKGCRLEHAPNEVFHTVVEGDTLFDLAAHFFGDGNRWPEIAAANHLPNPDLILPGEVLLIPGLGGPAGPPKLVAVDENSHLVVRFGSQHLFEFATPTEGNPPPQPPPADVPVPTLAAGESRVVFAIAPGAEIEFTATGVLAALRTLRLRVAPLALPRLGEGEVLPPELAVAPTRPADDVTAIEAPFRLIVSPSSRGAFTHETVVSAAPDDAARVELWHTRLAVRTQVDGVDVVDESNADQRIVRALWTRDDDSPAPPGPGFLGSLEPGERRAIVRQSADQTIMSPVDPATRIVPRPLDVDRFYLSAAGAWIDWRAEWNELDYRNHPPSLLAYRHLAPMGRDAYVRTEKLGFLFPFGHLAKLVKVTERRVGPEAKPVARLFQRTFIVLREPHRHYVGRDLPFTDVLLEPQVTPDLNPVANPAAPFIPAKGTESFRWKITGIDHVGAPFVATTPLVFVSVEAANQANIGLIDSLWDSIGPLDLGGQDVAMAPSDIRGDTTIRVQDLTLDGIVDLAGFTSTPKTRRAVVVLPALEAVNRGTATKGVKYVQGFVDNGFQAGDKAQVFLELESPTTLGFADGSDRGGGFVEPSVGIRSVSRTLGAIGATPSPALAQGNFDPAQFLQGVTPKLFGMFSLLEILETATLGEAPKLIGEQLGFLAGLDRDFARLKEALAQAITTLDHDIAHAAHAGSATVSTALRGDIATALAGLAAGPGDVIALLTQVAAGQDVDFGPKLAELRNALGGLAAVRANNALPTSIRSAIDKRLTAIDVALAIAGGDLQALRKTLAAAFASSTIRYEWRPPLKPWKDVFLPARDGLSIAVEIRMADNGAPHSDVTAQLRSFALQLMPGEPLMRLQFSRMGFRVGTGRKAEVEVVFDKLEFLGILGFVDKLRELIPFDGFADPPYVDISPQGATAGFTLALPSVAVGVFSLENIALSADCRVPFLGEVVTVGFGFCAKEAPFRLTVMAIGGGGWVALRLSPAKLVMLEVGLEAGACLSVNLGVASGSVSVMVGVYMRLEDDKGQLTGYFRIRGEMDVLGLVSASITLELALTYHFDTGKLVGRASIQVEIEVLFFSASVEVSCERQLAGSKGDPTLKMIMPPTAGGEDMWNKYFAAFAIGG